MFGTQVLYPESMFRPEFTYRGQVGEWFPASDPTTAEVRVTMIESVHDDISACVTGDDMNWVELEEGVDIDTDSNDVPF